MEGPNTLLTHVLAVREVASLPTSAPEVPRSLSPSPPMARVAMAARHRETAADQWSAWWRIVWAQNIARHRQVLVRPAPPLLGLEPVFVMDPPKFSSLAAVPELKQAVVSTWPELSPWGMEMSLEEYWDERNNWAADVIAEADAKAGRPVADVAVHLEILPVEGSYRWLLTESPERAVLHALVTPELAADQEDLRDWLVRLLQRFT
jgi:hypothetical protein